MRTTFEVIGFLCCVVAWGCDGDGDGRPADAGHPGRDAQAQTDAGDPSLDAGGQPEDDGGGGRDGGEPGGDAGADAAVEPTQLVLLDVVYTHDVETMAFSFLPVGADVPDDLTAPADYSQGHLHLRVDVRSKPSDLPVSYQLCFFQDDHTSDNHACGSYADLTGVGVVEMDQPMPEIWQYGVIEWWRPLLDLMLVVKDGDGDPVDTRYGFDGQWEGSPDLGLYYPMQVRATAVVVPPGGQFQGWPE